MNRDIIYKEIKEIAMNHKIEFNTDYLRCGRGVDCGELCIDYSILHGYILFAYDRDLRTYYYSNKDKEEFKYTVFHHLCNHNGFECEFKHRKTMNKNSDELEDNTRKVAFEYSLKQLNSISTKWMERATPEYEELLNKWREIKNVFFDKHELKFKLK